MGLGAGHTPAEWEALGQHRPTASERVARLREVVEVVVRLLAGETVTFEGQHVHIHQARLDDLPVGGDITLTIGGGHRDLLSLAVEYADIVALSGLGKTLPDGHRHEVRWSPKDLDAKLALVRGAARRTGRTPILEALIQQVVVTPNRSAVLSDLARRLPGPAVTVEHLAGTPHLLIGTHEQMAQQLLVQAKRWNIRRYVIREPAVPDFEPVLAMLASAGSVHG